MIKAIAILSSHNKQIFKLQFVSTEPISAPEVPVLPSLSNDAHIHSHDWCLQGLQYVSDPSTAQARTPKTGCPGTCLAGFWRSPRKRLHSLSEQTVPGLCHCTALKCFLLVRKNLLFQFVTTASYCGTGHHWKESGSALFCTQEEQVGQPYQYRHSNSTQNLLFKKSPP